MINEIKLIVKNYLNNAKLSNFLIGEVVTGGVKINEKLTIPDELVVGNLKKTITSGDKVRILQNQGGQQYYILEVIE